MMRLLLVIFGLMVTGCNDEWLSRWEGRWTIDRDNLIVDVGRCPKQCEEILYSVPSELNISVQSERILRDYVFVDMNCGRKCLDINGSFDGTFTDVENKSFLSLSGNLKLEGKQCGLFIKPSDLNLGKISRKRMSFQIQGSGIERNSKTRCRVIIDGFAKRK